MIKFENIAEYLKEPLVLIGFGILIFYYLFRNVLKAQLLKKLSKESNEKITVRIFNSIITIVLLIIILGFALQFYKVQDNPDYETENKFIELLAIKNLNEKISTFKFNISGNDSILLNYRSRGWNFEAPFYIEPTYLVRDLKFAIIDHFELKKYLRFHSYGGELTSEFIFKANNKTTSDENVTLREAGINSNDIITIRIIAEYFEVTEEAAEEVAEEPEE